MAQDEGPQGIVSADDMTGRESYYTEYAGNQIMFHVSTLLPYAANDPQQARPSESARGTSGAACVHGRAAYGRADCAPPPRRAGHPGPAARAASRACAHRASTGLIACGGPLSAAPAMAGLFADMFVVVQREGSANGQPTYRYEPERGER